jgi:hypothetical protein
VTCRSPLRIVVACVGVLAFVPSAAVPYAQQLSERFGLDEGLPSLDVRAVAVSAAGTVLVGTAGGLVESRGGRFVAVPALGSEPVTSITTRDATTVVATRSALWRRDGGGAWRHLTDLGRGARALALADPAAQAEGAVVVATDEELLLCCDDRGGVEKIPTPETLRLLDVAVGSSGCPLLIAAEQGAWLRECGERPWQRLLPAAGDRSWAPIQVEAILLGEGRRLALASPQGLALRSAEGVWRLLDGRDGLPWNDFSALAATSSGALWLGTRLGAIHFDGAGWQYRQGPRWLPGDEVRDIAVGPDGEAWVATDGGLARIGSREMGLGEKAEIFEEAIDRFHRRTPWQYIDAVILEQPGDTSSFRQRDSDNDGLWTGMYGAGQCFAYAATGHERYRERARKAFEALAHLSEVTQGGSPPAEPGFVARSILPTSGPDPNEGRAAEDRRLRSDRDGLWKLIEPRWATSADGEWYWKTDASSDELDGHYFLYAAYFEHVAQSEAERDRVRTVVRRVTDHLLDHGFALVDHDGRRTRWAVFGPEQLNHDRDWWEERGLNSLSMLSYLRVAAYVTGDERYEAAARELIEEHSYAANARVPKLHTGPGTGNQSDDEMAFMNFYNLLRYERDPDLRALWGHAFLRYWQMEAGERNPLFHFLYAASVEPGDVYPDPFGAVDLAPTGDWLEDSIDTLERYPLDRIDWPLRNSHRLDVELLEGESGRGRRRDGKVLPIDERFVGHWNHDPWRLDQGGEGRRLADGASFLLPYYLGLYEGFVPADESR